MIKEPACERKCQSPLDSIAVGYRHGEERDVVTGTAQCPLLIPSLRVMQVSMNANIGAARPCHVFSMPMHGRHLLGGGETPAVLSLVGTGAVLAIHHRKERSAIARIVEWVSHLSLRSESNVGSVLLEDWGAEPHLATESTPMSDVVSATSGRRSTARCETNC